MEPSPPDPPRPSSRILQILRAVLAARQRGKPVPDDKVIAAHPELRQELAVWLPSLSRVGKALKHTDAELEEVKPELWNRVAAALPKYELARRAFRGGQARVFPAVHRTTKRKVAIKVVLGEQRDRLDYLDQFKREAQILGKLRDPNIVTIYDAGVIDELCYIVMDFIEGVPFDQYVSRARLTPTEVLPLFMKACRAVNAAHMRGIIHRDLKPSNVLVDVAGEPHVLDFGLAELAGQVPTGTRTVPDTKEPLHLPGTLLWAGPEQDQAGPSAADTRGDVYALGLMLFNSITGDYPFRISDDGVSYTVEPGHLCSDIDPELNAIVVKCLHCRPKDRYESAGALHKDLKRYVTGDPIEAVRLGPTYIVRKLVWKYRAQILLTLSVVLTLFAVATGGVLLWRRAESERHKRQILLAQTELDNGRPSRAREIQRTEHERHPCDDTRLLKWTINQRFPLRAADLQHRPQIDVEFAPDGRFLATVGLNGEVTFRDGWTLAVAGALPGDGARARCVKYSSAGDRLYVGYQDGRVRAWQLSIGRDEVLAKLVMTLKSSAPISRLALSADARWLAVGTTSGTVQDWLVIEDPPRPVHTWDHVGAVSDLAFSQDGMLLACTGEKTEDEQAGPGGIWVWNLDHGDVAAVQVRVSGGQYRGVRFSADGKELYFGREGLWVWNLETDEKQMLEGYADWGVRALDASLEPSNRFMAAADGNGVVHFYDTVRRRSLPIWGYHEIQGVVHLDVVFSPNSKTVATAGPDGLRLWDFPPIDYGELVWNDTRYESRALSLCADGQHVLFVARPLAHGNADSDRTSATPPPAVDDQIFLWDRAAHQLRAVPCGMSSQYDHLTVSHEEHLIAILGADAHSSQLAVFAHLPSVGADPEVYSLPMKPTAMQWLAADPPTLLLGYAEGSLRTWRSRSAKNDATSQPKLVLDWPKGLTPSCTCLTADRHGRWIVAAWENVERSGQVRVWRATDRSIADATFDEAYEPHSEFDTIPYTWSVAIVGAENARPLVAVAGNDRVVRLHDAKTGTVVGKLQGHTNVVRQCLVLGDRFLVTASDDKTVRIWNWRERRQVCIAFQGRDRRPLIATRAGRVVVVDGSVASILEPPIID